MTLLFVTYVFIVFVSDYNNEKLSNFPVHMIISSIPHLSTFIRYALSKVMTYDVYSSTFVDYLLKIILIYICYIVHHHTIYIYILIRVH